MSAALRSVPRKVVFLTQYIGIGCEEKEGRGGAAGSNNCGTFRRGKGGPELPQFSPMTAPSPDWEKEKGVRFRASSSLPAAGTKKGGEE